MANRKFNAWYPQRKCKSEAKAVVKIVADDDWWPKVQGIIQLLEPVMDVLRLTDSAIPNAGKIYAAMIDLQERMRLFAMSGSEIAKALPDLEWKDIKAAVLHRWKMLHTPTMAAGYCLDLEYLDTPHYRIQEVMDGLKTMAKNILRDDAKVASCLAQFCSFKDMTGELAHERESAKTMSPGNWWRIHGARFPELQLVAMRVLHQVTSASACERNWSEFDFIWNRKRNRLSPTRATKLVYIHANMRLLRRVKEYDYSQDYFEWDGVELDGEPYQVSDAGSDSESQEEETEDNSIDR